MSTTQTEHQIADAEQVLDLMKKLFRKGIEVLDFGSSGEGANPYVFVNRTQELDLYMMDKKVVEIKDDDIQLFAKYTHEMGCTICWEAKA